ncbi:MAG: MFS transporter [Planktomarina sp.]
MALSVGQKAGWGLADLGIVTFVMIKQLLILDFLANFLGVPVGIAGLVTTGILIFDIITDPLIGYMSDHTKSRFGRRTPWIAVGALVLVIGMVGMFAGPSSSGGNWSVALAWVAGFFVLATIGFTMAAIPYAATAGEMTTDPHERSKLLAWRMAFASLGILIGGGVVPMLAGGAKEGHVTAVMMIAPLVLLSIWGSLWATRNAPRVDKPATVSAASMLGYVARNKPFMALMVVYGIMTLAIAQVTAGMPFAARYLVSADGSGLPVLTLLFAPFVVGAMVSQPLWAFLSIKGSKRQALTIGLCFYCLVLCAIFMALPSTNLGIMIGLMFLAGTANGAYQAIPWALYPDHMDTTRAETGEAIEGVFSAMWLFGQKVANAFAPMLLGGLIASAGWQEGTDGAAVQTPEALFTLQWSMTLVPVGIFAIALYVLLRIYVPLARKEQG